MNKSRVITATTLPLYQVIIIILAILLMALLNSSPPLQASEKNSNNHVIAPNAAYPEGPVFIDGALYFTEMNRNRVMKLERGAQNNGSKTTPKIFYYQKDCGPTALARFQTNKFVILCHLSDELVILDNAGKPIRHIKKDDKGINIFHPNDCIKDDKGGVYLSAPGHFDRTLQPMGRLFYLNNQGSVQELAKNLIYPNGVAIYNNHLYVSEHLNRKVLKYKIKNDTTLGKASLFTDFKTAPAFITNDPNYTPQYAGPDGIEISAKGEIYIAEYARGRILQYNAAGTYQRTITTHLPYTTNMALDPATGTLIITGTKSLDTFLQLGDVYQIKIPKKF